MERGDVNLANLESFDSTIKAGEDILVMQGEQCVGSARASAPAWGGLALLEGWQKCTKEAVKRTFSLA